MEYEKKDITASPNVTPRPEFPVGWEHFVKRGMHCVRNPAGLMRKFKTRAEALEWANV